MTMFRIIEKYRIVVIVLSTFPFWGCKKLISVNSPSGELVTQNVFTDADAATSAVLGIYTEMASDGITYNIPLYTGFSGDELTNYSTVPGLVQFYQDNVDPLSGMSGNLWTPIYNYIYQANAVINGLSADVGVSKAVKQQLIGECEFIRGFWYFYLVNLFGSVPLLITPNYASNAVAPNTDTVAIYSQIIGDLTNALTLLNGNFVDQTDTTATTGRVRPTKWAAAAMLSRVYLYLGKWDSAEGEATYVINNSGTFSLCPNLNSVFLANSSEAILQLQIPQPALYNTYEGQNFILTSAPLQNTSNCSTISPQLLSAFETGDQRLTDWIGAYSSGSDTFYFPYKYKVANNSNITEYSMVIRLGELYLIRAEAEAQAMNLSAAAADLDAIRARAGLQNIQTSTQSGILSAIYHERQVEFFTEWGHRWFDLKRTGQLNTIMPTLNTVKNANWTPTDQLYPIPQIDITNDPKLTQNPGYE